MPTNRLEQELKRGSAELLVLALLEQQERYGYEISRLISERSEGAIVFHVTSLYPTLYRLERKGLIEGRWVDKARPAPPAFIPADAGRARRVAGQRSLWGRFFAALDRIAGIRHAGDGGRHGAG